jgi:O-antigen biosynthesis protein
MSSVAKAFSRLKYFLQTGYIHFRGERVNPDFPDENFQNHLKVYKFAAQFARSKRVLDVGCGTGYGAWHLSGVAASVVGIDISRQAIRLAKSKYPSLQYAVMDAHDLEFEDSTFDLVVSTENFEHLADQYRHLRELRRVLVPGGLCFIATPNPEMFAGVHNPHHTKENSYVELRELLSAVFSEHIIIENLLPHDLDRPHGIVVNDAPIEIFGQAIDKTYLHNTHSFFCFCR